MCAAISDLWAYISLTRDGGDVNEALCFFNGRPLVATSEIEAREMLRQAVLTPGRVRLRHFSVTESSGSVSLAFADLVEALEHLGDRPAAQST